MQRSGSLATTATSAHRAARPIAGCSADWWSAAIAGQDLLSGQQGTAWAQPPLLRLQSAALT